MCSSCSSDRPRIVAGPPGPPADWEPLPPLSPTAARLLAMGLDWAEQQGCSECTSFQTLQIQEENNTE